MEKKVIISIRNLVKTYGEGEALMYALNDVSLDVYEHDFLVILGGSGCGKSTLLNMIGGMDRVDGGSIFVGGEDVCKFNDNKLTLYRRDTVGFVYQFFNLINDITIYQNVTLAPTSRNKQRALDLLDRVGLLDKKDKFPRQVSGGQQQRVAIARALNKDSDILLCDEPTGALDDVSGKAVLKLLEDIHNEGKTIILVTHTKEIAQMANRIVTMRSGKIISDVINENIVKAEEVEW
ncbi:MAG: ABC transporter ATP-binding protein [Clostridia bacterium]|nr:ABC transporter ATP-binding protein [Clostridia bacterium]